VVQPAHNKRRVPIASRTAILPEERFDFIETDLFWFILQLEEHMFAAN
jgi:hypothetical protein